MYSLIILLTFAIGNGIYADISAEDLKNEYANEHSQFIEVNEMGVHYRDEGEGFPIVLILEQQPLCIPGMLGQMS